MCLFNFVQQHHAVRAAAHGLRQLPALAVAHIARRRAQQACHRVLFHIFAHIKAQKRLFTAKAAIRQRPGQRCFSHARGPQEQKRSHGARRAGKPKPGALQRARNGAHRVRLAYHAAGQRLLHRRQRGRLGRRQLFGRHPALARHHRRDVRRRHGGLFRPSRPLRSLDAHRAARLVQQVQRLVRQETFGQIPRRKRHCRPHSLRRDLHSVMRRVARRKPLQDLHGGLLARLLHLHRAEAPGQRRVLFNVAAVFHPRCRADELDVPARQQGLEDAAGVDAALRRARAHDGVHLVDE